MRVTLTTIALSSLLIVQHTAEAYDRRIMLCLVNKERVTRGLTALGPNAALDRAAQRHSDDQARFKFMEHRGTDGSDPGIRIEQAGYNWISNRENIAYGQKDEHEVMKEWMNSPGHRVNILSKNIIHLGSAVAYNGDVPYYTQNFGSDGTKGVFSACPSTYTYPSSSAPAPAPTYTPAPATPRPSYADVVKAPAPAPETTTTYSNYSPPTRLSYGYNTNTNTRPSNNNSYRSNNESNYYSSYSSNSHSSNNHSSNSYSSNDSSEYSSGNSRNSYSSSEPSSFNNSNSRPTEWTCIQRNSDGSCCRWKKCTGNSKSWTCRERWGNY